LRNPLPILLSGIMIRLKKKQKVKVLFSVFLEEVVPILFWRVLFNSVLILFKTEWVFRSLRTILLWSTLHGVRFLVQMFFVDQSRFLGTENWIMIINSGLIMTLCSTPKNSGNFLHLLRVNPKIVRMKRTSLRVGMQRKTDTPHRLLIGWRKVTSVRMVVWWIMRQWNPFRRDANPLPLIIQVSDGCWLRMESLSLSRIHGLHHKCKSLSLVRFKTCAVRTYPSVLMPRKRDLKSGVTHAFVSVTKRLVLFDGD